MVVEHLKTGLLVPYARNSRTHSDEQISQIMSSINEFGFTNPILIDNDGMIIAGHGRLMAAQRLQIDTVPCIRLGHLTDVQKRAYVIADNKIALNAGWDEDMLRIELGDLNNIDFDLLTTGFSAEEIGEFGFDDDPPDVDESKADEVPDAEDAPIVKLGDLIDLGNHRLLCGDSTKEEDVARLMGGELADQLVTDPPYNVSYKGKTKDALTIENDFMENDSFRQFLVDAYRSADSVMKCGATFYIWHADSEGYNFRGACFDVGWMVRQCLIWKKNSLVMGGQDYHWIHEPCLYGWKDGAAHLWAADRKQTTVLEFNRPSKSEIHPTMKPVELIEYNISNNTIGQDIVLDPFLGSGTTMIACENLGRRCRGVELDPKYAQVIVQRYVDYTSISKIKINGKEVDWYEYKDSMG